ncbi:collagen-like protein [Mesonia sp. K7]|uniref:collagen-like protein n=1 Tax=Mesonia sp. K7 TaxID=2218606 RepID=UPI000DA8D6F5|nr:collagen-like protein [Mesonia sp. K7]PZD79447.1 collagen-like protein [Mesonia sp. K7]
MKNIFILLFIATGLWACEGDPGPIGPQGPQGEPGLLGTTFEATVDFIYEPQPNLYSTLVDIPTSIDVFPSDAVLVYRLEIAQGTNGPIDTWSLIPQNFFVNQGTIQYVYNHTDIDVELLIDGNFDLSNLDTGFTQDQVFRFVVLPSDYLQDPNFNFETYNALQTSIDQQGFELGSL